MSSRDYPRREFSRPPKIVADAEYFPGPEIYTVPDPPYQTFPVRATLVAEMTTVALSATSVSEGVVRGPTTNAFSSIVLLLRFKEEEEEERGKRIKTWV